MSGFRIVSLKSCAALRRARPSRKSARLSLSEKTVSTYRTRLLEKMQMHSNAELIQYALREGLVE